MDSFIEVIGNVGFPIAIAMFLLVRVEAKLDQLRIAINELSSNIDNLKRN